MTVAQKGLSNNQLKIIAMVTMLCDHAGRELFPSQDWMTVVGRLAFPIFAFMIAEGCAHTRNRNRYLLQILGMALFCQAVYFVATGSLYQNVLITFVLSLLIIFAVDTFRARKTAASAAVAVLALGAACVLTLVLPEVLPGFFIDYGLGGVLLPVAVYYARGKWEKLLAAAVVLAALAAAWGGEQWVSLLALVLLALYNGERGRYRMKYLFYFFYPAHMGLVYLIGLLW